LTVRWARDKLLGGERWFLWHFVASRLTRYDERIHHEILVATFTVFTVYGLFVA
jgi:hypothetical protein